MNRRRLARELAIAAIVVAVGVARWHGYLAGSGVGYDEKDYLAGFRAVSEGRSPYQAHRFLYPPAFAVLGAQTVDLFGELRVVRGFRIANLLGVCAVALLATAGTGWPAWGRTAAAAAVTAGSPLVAAAFLWGNLSPLVVALTLVGLRASAATAAGGGALVGLGIALKPMAPGGVPVVLASRGGRRSGWTFAGSAGVVAAALLVPGLDLMPAFVQRSRELPMQVGNLSLLRVVRDLGVPVGPLAALAAVAALGALWAWRRRPLGPVRETALAAAVALLALPVVWAHTLLLSYPVQALALARAVRDWRTAEEASPALVRLGGVAVAIAAVHGGHGFGLLGALAGTPALGWFATLLPMAAVAGLAAYATGTPDVAET